MKGKIKILSAITLLTIIFGCTFSDPKTEQEGSEEEYVYVCTGEYATRYHSNPYCKGLSSCCGNIEEITKEKAENMGRTPCRICY